MDGAVVEESSLEKMLRQDSANSNGMQDRAGAGTSASIMAQQRTAHCSVPQCWYRRPFRARMRSRAEGSGHNKSKE